MIKKNKTLYDMSVHFQQLYIYVHLLIGILIIHSMYGNY